MRIKMANMLGKESKPGNCKLQERQQLTFVFLASISIWSDNLIALQSKNHRRWGQYRAVNGCQNSTRISI
jgi:hypothetical protein